MPEPWVDLIIVQSFFSGNFNVVINRNETRNGYDIIKSADLFIEIDQRI